MVWSDWFGPTGAPAANPYSTPSMPCSTVPAAQIQPFDANSKLNADGSLKLDASVDAIPQWHGDWTNPILGPHPTDNDGDANDVNDGGDGDSGPNGGNGGAGYRSSGSGGGTSSGGAPRGGPGTGIGCPGPDGNAPPPPRGEARSRLPLKNRDPSAPLMTIAKEKGGKGVATVVVRGGDIATSPLIIAVNARYVAVGSVGCFATRSEMEGMGSVTRKTTAASPCESDSDSDILSRSATATGRRLRTRRVS